MKESTNSVPTSEEFRVYNSGQACPQTIIRVKNFLELSELDAAGVITHDSVSELDEQLVKAVSAVIEENNHEQENEKDKISTKVSTQVGAFFNV